MSRGRRGRVSSSALGRAQTRQQLEVARRIGRDVPTPHEMIDDDEIAIGLVCLGPLIRDGLGDPSIRPSLKRLDLAVDGRRLKIPRQQQVVCPHEDSSTR